MGSTIAWYAESLTTTCRARIARRRRRLSRASSGRLRKHEPMSVKYAVIFEKADDNWAAYVPDLPGCITTGKTMEETESNMREAIQGHLSTLREFGDLVPPPTSIARDIEVRTAA